ncbi:MAG TPA: pitrilysin family protein [Smithella sp.]|nr:pitrilysin family protein [Smithella sp.]
MMKKNKLFKSVFIVAVIVLMHGLCYGFDLENKVIKTKLKNGLTVLMLERHLSPTVSLYIRHRVGAVDEKPGESGAAHFLEHMMFKGTTTIGAKNYPAEKILLDKIEKTGNAMDRERRKGPKADPAVIKKLAARLKKLQDQSREYFIPNEIDRLYTENGGLNMNASTGQDVTTYQVSLPANKIELWARIESDRLLHPVFREFYSEREVIMEERRQRVEVDPDGKLYEAFLNAAYKTHAYGRPVLGWTEDMKYLSPASVRYIYEKYRAPQSIVIAVVGDINPKDTLKLIDKYFGAIPPVKVKNNVVPPEPRQTEERKVEVTFDANPMMIMGYHKPNAPAHDDYVFDVISTILTTGRTSRLYDLMVTKMGIAESVSSANGIPATMYPNLFVISAQPRYPHTNTELEDVILKEIEKLKSEPVTDTELNKAKNQLKMDYIKSLDSNDELASMLSYYEVLLGDYRYITNYLKIIDGVSARDIQNAAKLYLNKENLTIAFLNKKKD